MATVRAARRKEAWRGAAPLLVALVVALLVPLVPTHRADALAGDPEPCAVGVDDGTCIPNNSTPDPDLFDPDPVTFPDVGTPTPVNGTVYYPITLPVPGLPVCTTGFGGGIVNAPCFTNQYWARFWYQPTPSDAGFWNKTFGDFGPSHQPEFANGPSGTLRMEEGTEELFLVENDTFIVLPGQPEILVKSYGLLDTRGGSTPPDQPPAASFVVEQVSPTDFGLFRFTSSATDPDGNDTITGQTWDFGDGEVGVGPQVIHEFAKPGSYVVTLRVVDAAGEVDESSQVVVVPAPALRVEVSLPDVVGNQLAPGLPTLARVTVSAGDGEGALTDVAFVDAVLAVSPDGAIEVDGDADPPVPSTLALEPGTSQSFDVPIHAAASGTFTLSSTAHATDAAGRPTGAVTGSLDGTVSGLAVELRSGATGQDTVDVVVTVRNVGSAPLEDIRYRGGGAVLHPEFVPDALRGVVRLVAGPSGALPARLEPGQAVDVRYTYQADGPGDVAVTVDATATAGRAEVTANDAGFIGAQKRAMTVEQLQDILAQLAQGELDNLQARAQQWQRIVNESINARVVAARARGALVDFPADVVRRLGDAAGPVAPYPEIDNVKLTATAVLGYAKGLGRGVGKVVDFTVGTPATYWASIVGTADFGQAAQDYADAGKSAVDTADALAYGGFSTAFQAWAAFEEQGIGTLNPAQYDDLTTALNDEYKGQMLRYAAIAPELQADQAKFDAYLDQVGDEILRDPYGWADKVTGYAGELGGETLAGEAVVRGGVKLAESAMTSYEYSRYGASGKAITRLTEGETLESLGAGPTTSTNIERLGGITETDQQKIHQVAAEVQEKFGVELEIQARPSNVHSVQYLNSELGAVGKPEIFKAKNISDVDVVIGADPSALGKLGVFEPHLPPENVMAKMPSELATEVRNRYATQKKVWKDWNDPASVFRKNYEKAAQPGGGVFDFEVPTASGDVAPNAPRKYEIEVGLSKKGRNATQTFFEKTTGKPIVSDIDFHGYFKTNGKMLDAGTRGQIELYLQKRWKETGISFGDHGATLNGFDWAGSGTQGGAVARHKFGLEFMEPAAAQARAEELAAELGVPVEKLLEGYIPGKFVVTFRRGGVSVGFGQTF